MGIGALILMGLAFKQGGWERLTEGLVMGGGMLLHLTPLMFLAFTSAGLISALISDKTVSRWLGRESGLKGLFLGALAGALVPGGPYVFFPLAVTFLASGAQIGVILAFVTAKNLWSLSRLPMEVALMGPRVTFVRYMVTFAFPILIGLIANALFSRFTEQIRDEMKEFRHSGRAKGA